jgi:hypothetical protein
VTVANMLVCPYNDFDDATLSVNVTLAAGYGAENTQNTDRGKVLRTADTTTMVLTGVWPENRTINGLWLFRHLLHGASFRLQLFSDTGASSAVSGGDSTSLPALCYTPSEPYVWSKGSNDPFQFESPTWFYYADAGKTARSFKLTVSGTPSLVSYFLIGRIVIGQFLRLARDPDFGFADGATDLSRHNRTDGGSRRSYVGQSYRTANADLNDIDADEVATWRQIHRQTGTARDIVVSVFPGDGTSEERDYTWNCFLSSLDAIGFQVSRFTKKLQFEEA